jgi:hypothetical protein
MSNPISSLFNVLFGGKKDWWIEIRTQTPACTYYFGPFSSEAEAIAAKGGYIEDLEHEGALGIQSTIQNCSQPDQLTVFDEPEDYRPGVSSPVFSS